MTGGTSYIGKHVIAELIIRGYYVRTTVRIKSKIQSVKTEIEEYLRKKISMDAHVANLLNDDGWDEAISGCDAIIHIAGPFPIGYDGEEKELTNPHQEGVTRLFDLAKKHGVNRIILTSSVATVWMDPNISGRSRRFSEENWTDYKDKSLDAYTKGKTLAEKAAWKFSAKHKSLKLTTILPAVVLGTGIGKPIRRGSMELFIMLINKEMFVAPPLKMGFVDVRDVAKVHVNAIENDDSIGKRVIVVENSYWIKDFCRMINSYGHKAPTISPPAFIVKLIAKFDKTIQPVRNILGVDVTFDTEYATTNLKFKPLPIEKTIKDTSIYLKKYKKK